MTDCLYKHGACQIGRLTVCHMCELNMKSPVRITEDGTMVLDSIMMSDNVPYDITIDKTTYIYKRDVDDNITVWTMK